jgi:hypothetical protein
VVQQLTQGHLRRCRGHHLPILGQQILQRSVQIRDQALSQRDPDQGRDHALGDRPKVFVIIGGEPVPVVLQLGLAIDHDQHSTEMVQQGRLGADVFLDTPLERHTVDAGRRIARHG